MSKAGKRILQAANEAVRYARGEDVPGLIVHASRLALDDRTRF